MESKVRHGYDAELALRAPNSAALVADTTSTKIGIDRIINSMHGVLDGRYENREFAVVLVLTAGFAQSVAADETYTLNFNTYDKDGANAVTHLSKTFTAADVGSMKVFVFDTGTLATEDADAAQFAVALDVAGTSPSAEFFAYLAPVC